MPSMHMLVVNSVDDLMRTAKEISIVNATLPPPFYDC